MSIISRMFIWANREREGSPSLSDLPSPQFTHRGWEEYVGACRRALDKAFPDNTWSMYVDDLTQQVQTEGEHTEALDDFRRQVATAMFCYSAEAILYQAGPELRQSAEVLGDYLLEELKTQFPQQFVGGRVPMVRLPSHPGDFRKR